MGQSIRATVCALLLASTFLNRPAGASDPNAPSEPGRPGPGALGVCKWVTKSSHSERSEESRSTFPRGALDPSLLSG